MRKNSRLLPLAGAHNVRELGGYPTKTGGLTHRGAFLRADSTGALTEADIVFLKQYGVTLAIDMRSPFETQKSPSLLSGITGIRYENVVLFDGVQSAGLQGKLPDDMAGMYIHLLEECKDTYRHLFTLLAENEGVSLFHCTVGKDRTGVVAMLLLELAGVDDARIVEDYAETDRYMAPVLGQQLVWLREQGIDVPESVLRALPQSMEKTLAHLHAVYQNAEGYLFACGLTPAQIVTLRRKLTGEVPSEMGNR